MTKGLLGSLKNKFDALPHKKIKAFPYLLNRQGKAFIFSISSWGGRKHFYRCSMVAKIGTNNTVTKPTTTTDKLAIAASVSPISKPTDTPKACPDAPRAKPLEIGFLMLNHLIKFLPKA